MILVSIPFQRESPFGLTNEEVKLMGNICFNSLPTGKSFRTQEKGQKDVHRPKVSIPFQRESPFGQWFRLRLKQIGPTIVSIPFQRESPFGLRLRYSNILPKKVSIPFQRESPFGPWQW